VDEPRPMRVTSTILSALAEPVLVLDSSLRAVMANRAFYHALNITPLQLEGKSLEELVAIESDYPRVKAILDAVLANDGTVESIVIECTVPPSKRMMMLMNARHLTTEESPTGLVLVELRDVTKEREAALIISELNLTLQRHGAVLEAINGNLETFTHTASHDLRSPLRVTNKIAHLLLQEHRDELSDGAAAKTRLIIDSTEEMGTLLEDLLLFAQAKHIPIQRRRVDMRRVAQDAFNELQNEGDCGSPSLVIDDLPPFEADGALMKQVFLNLLGNALKFSRSRDRAEIRVGFIPFNNTLAYFVQDNGVGFHMDHAEALFVAFRRLHKEYGYKGSGIGLALVKRIIEHHDGSVWAVSAPGKGSAFYFTLCRTSTDEQPVLERVSGL
jgi:signal transduction histidine kinase